MITRKIISLITMLMFSTGLTHTIANSTGQAAYNNDYYGYSINMGDIYKTDIAEKLNNAKPQIMELLNSYVPSGEYRYDVELDYLTLDDIDFNSPDSVGTVLFNFYPLYTKSELTYEEFFEYQYPTDEDFVWYWFIQKNDTVFSGEIQKDDGVLPDKYEIKIDEMIFTFNSVGPSVSKKSDKTCKSQIASLLKLQGETSTNIEVGTVYVDYGRPSLYFVIFVDGKAKYICNDTFGTEIAMFTHLRENTPEPVRTYLGEKAQELKTLKIMRTNDYLIYPYDEFVKIVKTSKPWVDNNYMSHFEYEPFEY